MDSRPAVTPNRRGMKSRELVLDAAERVMATDGFEAATLARVVAESGIPMSSVYHYYGSKDGILLAVMERGAERFFADLPDPDRRVGPAAGAPAPGRRDGGRDLGAPPELPAALDRLCDPAAAQRRGRGRRDRRARARAALDRLRKQISIAFDDDPRAARTDQLARFALAAFDGAFVAWQTDPGATLGRLLAPLPAALAAARRLLK